jgi:FkbM family methyltransferase
MLPAMVLVSRRAGVLLRAAGVLAGVALIALIVWAIVERRLPMSRTLAFNLQCCQLPVARAVTLTFEETVDRIAGRVRYPSEIGQDKWVLEVMFPELKNGFFVDVGSGPGFTGSNSWALEQRGWTGLCIDPMPTQMNGRTCRVFEEVVFSERGRRMTFHAAGGLAGLADTLGKWRAQALGAPTLEFETVTLADILDRAQAPPSIHFLSIDIEGAELEALKGFPFDRFTVGSMAIEHNDEEPKRTDILKFLEARGYQRVHTYKQDDFFAAR